MAWNPSPTVAAARDFAKKFSKQQVIILSLDLHRGTLQSDSYGETKFLCDEAKWLADVAYEAVIEAYRKGRPKLP